MSLFYFNTIYATAVTTVTTSEVDPGDGFNDAAGTTNALNLDLDLFEQLKTALDRRHLSSLVRARMLLSTLIGYGKRT